jgi:broad specificity phosphatase PhoE
MAGRPDARQVPRRRALLTVAGRSAGATSLVVAHGANLRAALPCLSGQPDPGADLPVGTAATLQLSLGHPDTAIQLLNWPTVSPR